MSVESIDGEHFRRVLGTLPTGVAVIAGTSSAGLPIGMTVGSLASVSLDPPLVSFMANRGSATWERLRETGSFCANVLSDEQEDVCRTFAGREPDKFAGVPWTPAPSGSPIIDGVVAWIDCDIDRIVAAGDHDLILGRVRGLQPGVPALPLVFLRGAYGRVGLRSFAAWHEDLMAPLRLADLARSRLEKLSAELNQECILTAAVQEELVLLASAGTPSFAGLTRVGQRMPFVPPLGSLFVAWAPQEAQQMWRKRLAGLLPKDADAQLDGILERVRQRGFTAGTGRLVHVGAERLLADSLSVNRAAAREHARASWDVLREGVDPEVLDQQPGHEVRSLAVPIRDGSGSVVLSVGVHRLDADLDVAAVEGYVSLLVMAANDISRTISAAPRP